MSLTADIARFENNRCRFFAAVSRRDYGRLYHDRDNPLSYDSNHALILNLGGNLDSVIREVCHFYRKLGLTPRVYHGFVPTAEKRLLPKLLAAGFKSEFRDEQYLLWKKPSSIKPVPGFELRRIRKLNDEVIGIIGPDDVWTSGVIKRQIGRDTFHLLVGYTNGKAVALAELELADGISRVDGVTTHPKHRCKGYGHALMHHIVNYHQKISGNALYLYSSNPDAIRIYVKAGFRKIRWAPRKWAAWLPEISPSTPAIAG